jgi:hypothetical protein
MNRGECILVSSFNRKRRIAMYLIEYVQNGEQGVVVTDDPRLAQALELALWAIPSVILVITTGPF